MPAAVRLGAAQNADVYKRQGAVRVAGQPLVKRHEGRAVPLSLHRRIDHQRVEHQHLLRRRVVLPMTLGILRHLRLVYLGSGCHPAAGLQHVQRARRQRVPGLSLIHI